MTGVVAAFSLSEQMKTLGAYAGLAALLGLAVLAMLCIAQARELRRLREWAEQGGQAPDALSPAASVSRPTMGERPAPPVNPAPASAPAQAKQAAAAVARVATAPVGAAATAVAAARKVGKGTPDDGAAAGNSVAEAAKAKAGPAGAAQVKGGAATAVAPTAPPAPASAAGKAAAPARAAQPASKTVPPRTPAAGGPSQAAPPAAGAAGNEGGSHMLAFVVGIVVVLLLVIGAVQLFSGGDDKLTPIEQASPPPSPVAPSPSGAVAPPAQVNRKSVTVAVLNGTTTNGLARGAANRLQRGGYRIGQVTNATDNSRSATSVSYAPGFRRAGLDVARVCGSPPGRCGQSMPPPGSSPARTRWWSSPWAPTRAPDPELVSRDARRDPVILLARHGQTAYNRERRFQGLLPVPLDDTGREQARELALLAGARGDIAALWCSPLARAQETAEIVAERLGLEPRPDPRFVETDCGLWTDRFFTDVAADDPEGFAAFLRADPAFRFPGGESLEEQDRRVEEGLAAVRAQGIMPALVVCHGMVIRLALARVRGDPSLLVRAVPNAALVEL